jgi:HEAT repeats
MAPLSDKKHVCVVLGLIIAAIFAVLSWRALHPFEPVYQGRSLGSWVRQLDDGDPWAGFSHHSWRTNLSVEQIQAAEAIRSIGTNALPFLVPLATRKDSPTDELLISIVGNRKEEENARKKRYERSWDAALALYALGPEAKPCLPQLKQAYYDYGNEGTARYAAVALAGIGPEGWRVLSDSITNTNWFACFGIWALANQHVTNPAIVDSLIDLLTNNIVFHSEESAWALGELGEEPERVVPILLNVYQSSAQPSMRNAAADALARFGAKAQCAVPALIKGLQDSDGSVRYTASNALKAIDFEAAAKAGAH